MTTTIFQPPDSGGGAGLDTYLLETSPNTNSGTDAKLYIGTTGKTPVSQHSIIEMDISSLVGVTVVTADLELNVTTGASIAFDFHIYRLRRSDWSEMQATWNIYKTANNWTTAGALDTTNDHDTSVGSAPFSAPTTTGALALQVETIVQDALDNRSGIFRVLIKPDNQAPATAANFLVDSAEGATASLRPKLTIVDNRGRRIFIA